MVPELFAVKGGYPQKKNSIFLDSRFVKLKEGGAQIFNPFRRRAVCGVTHH